MIVMTPRPGRIDRIIAIELPRPRDKAVVTSARFAEYCEEITECFMRHGVIQLLSWTDRMLKRPLTGVVAAPFLPMHDDGAIDWATLERYMDWIAAQGPGAIAMNMDASEVIALDRGGAVRGGARLPRGHRRAQPLPVGPGRRLDPRCGAEGGAAGARPAWRASRSSRPFRPSPARPCRRR